MDYERLFLVLYLVAIAAVVPSAITHAVIKWRRSRRDMVCIGDEPPVRVKTSPISNEEMQQVVRRIIARRQENSDWLLSKRDEKDTCLLSWTDEYKIPPVPGTDPDRDDDA